MNASIFRFNGTNLLFGSVFAGSSRIVVVDPSAGVVTLAYDSASRQPSLATYNGSPALNPVPGQKALCWSAYSADTRTAYLADGGVARLVEVDPFTGSSTVAILNITQETNSTSGLLDLAVGGGTLFALSGVLGSVVVVDVSGGRGSMEVKQVLPSGVVPKSSQGMAVLVR